MAFAIDLSKLPEPDVTVEIPPDGRYHLSREQASIVESLFRREQTDFVDLTPSEAAALAPVLHGYMADIRRKIAKIQGGQS